MNNSFLDNKISKMLLPIFKYNPEHFNSSDNKVIVKNLQEILELANKLREGFFRHNGYSDENIESFLTDLIILSENRNSGNIPYKIFAALITPQFISDHKTIAQSIFGISSGNPKLFEISEIFIREGLDLNALCENNVPLFENVLIHGNSDDVIHTIIIRADKLRISETTFKKVIDNKSNGSLKNLSIFLSSGFIVENSNNEPVNYTILDKNNRLFLITQIADELFQGIKIDQQYEFNSTEKEFLYARILNLYLHNQFDINIESLSDLTNKLFGSNPNFFVTHFGNEINFLNELEQLIKTSPIIQKKISSITEYIFSDHTEIMPELAKLILGKLPEAANELLKNEFLTKFKSATTTIVSNNLYLDVNDSQISFEIKKSLAAKLKEFCSAIKFRLTLCKTYDVTYWSETIEAYIEVVNENYRSLTVNLRKSSVHLEGQLPWISDSLSLEFLPKTKFAALSSEQGLDESEAPVIHILGESA